MRLLLVVWIVMQAAAYFLAGLGVVHLLERRRAGPDETVVDVTSRVAYDWAVDGECATETRR